MGCNACGIQLPPNRCGFQYPLRVEVGCNSKQCGGEDRFTEFQYPLRVEVGCNSSTAWRTLEMFLSFSTLYGSKWVATWKMLAIIESVVVSVPSTGRSGLQPSTHPSVALWNNGFSTLYGSKWVATTGKR